MAKSQNNSTTGETSGASTGAVQDEKTPEGRIMVVGPKGGRWRAGRYFGPEPTVIDVDDLTEEEGLALTSDPKLIVGPAFPAISS
jgi:hypothetical protein